MLGRAFAGDTRILPLRMCPCACIPTPYCQVTKRINIAYKKVSTSYAQGRRLFSLGEHCSGVDAWNLS